MSNIKIGHINFLNILPLTYSYRNVYANGLDIKYNVPSILNDDLANKRLDISHISSIVYARLNDDLLLLPNICIRADCDVESIMLISRVPIENLNGEKIILTSKSATSHCLLKIILSEGYNLTPKYFVDSVDFKNPVSDDSTAALLIGDDALYNYFHKPKNFYCYDLGKLWHELTGKSMTYAVWAVQKNFAENFPNRLQFAYEKIISGLNYGVKNKSAAINSILKDTSFTYDQLDHYLGNVIKWNFSNVAVEALQTYYKLAYKLNLIDRLPEIKFADVK